MQVHAPKEVEKLHDLVKKVSENEDSAIDSFEENECDTVINSEEDDQQEARKIANEQISDLEYMKKLMKGDGDASERKPRQKMAKKVKEKINLFTVKVISRDGVR